MLGRRVHEREQPAVVLGTVFGAGNEDRLPRQLPFAEVVRAPGAGLVVDLHDGLAEQLVAVTAGDVREAVSERGPTPVVLGELALPRQELLRGHVAGAGDTVTPEGAALAETGVLEVPKRIAQLVVLVADEVDDRAVTVLERVVDVEVEERLTLGNSGLSSVARHENDSSAFR